MINEHDREKMERITIRLTVDQLEYLDNLAETFRESRSFMIRMILCGYMKKHPMSKGGLL